MHLLSLDGMLAVLGALREGVEAAAPSAPSALPDTLPDPPAYVDIWTPLCEGRPVPVLEVRGRAGRGWAGRARVVGFLRLPEEPAPAAGARPAGTRQLLRPGGSSCIAGARRVLCSCWAWAARAAHPRLTWHSPRSFLPPQLLGLGSTRSASPADVARAEKQLKARLVAAAEHFNRDQKKGYQYLQARPFGGDVGGIYGRRA